MRFESPTGRLRFPTTPVSRCGRTRLSSSCRRPRSRPRARSAVMPSRSTPGFSAAGISHDCHVISPLKPSLRAPKRSFRFAGNRLTATEGSSTMSTPPSERGHLPTQSVEKLLTARSRPARPSSSGRDTCVQSRSRNSLAAGRRLLLIVGPAGDLDALREVPGAASLAAMPVMRACGSSRSTGSAPP